ncbi:MAG: iron transporter [Candidatus Portnoybacteria bacterium CG10_big_fil_rev_8_21_14_0_10_36_7]|uniref:Iron transporter n=1 Tax=Candidatus Portnoybacteria bacterium CG10_big_fil_rev_8_21_14_0_10_36_7 TaxID=1974812 RepID=A0A2M8KDX8_9BACT|nr:MAG: iron transporter [Candidatus Portnoybacteria bacterium CG10_big_fil_rev_8_21_14_0_10_36_7]
MLEIRKKIKKFFKILGPGIITGAADDDPSGIATYTQTGAQFGYGPLWTSLFALPFVTAVQDACARIGAVSGRGLTAVIKKHYSKPALLITIGLVVIANTINIGANIGAMASAAQLLAPVNFAMLAIFFTTIILLLEISLSYKIYVRLLKICALSLFAYVVTVFLINHPWGTILRATFIPHIELNFEFFFIITAIFGTTISPYMFFWEASQEVEEEKEKHMIVGGEARVTKHFIRRIRIDNFIGMLASQIGVWSIIVVAATVLNANGIINVDSAADAARALEPLVDTFSNSGLLAKVIFAFGIIGLGMLSIPILSSSASYAVSEAFGWREGLNLKFRRGHGFYGIIIIATLVGLLINFIGINPIKALVLTAVINGVISVPLIYIIARISRNEKIMGEYKSSNISNTLIWTTFFIMLASVVLMFISFILH